jgi:hypothetical protein
MKFMSKRTKQHPLFSIAPAADLPIRLNDIDDAESRADRKRAELFHPGGEPSLKAGHFPFIKSSIYRMFYFFATSA